MINQKIKRLRTEGFSFREISKKLLVPYSSVRRYCKNIRMSVKGKQRYHSKVKGVIKYIKIKKGLNKAKVRIISNLLFDGAVYENDYHYSIMYVNASRGMIDQFKEDMNRVYNISNPSFEKIKGKNVTVYRINYFSKQIYEDLLKFVNVYSTSDKKSFLPEVITNGKKAFKLILLRAFWENEGSISREGKLSADLKNFTMIKQLSKLHNEFNLKNYISKYWDNSWTYKLILNKSRENYKRFFDLKLFSKSIASKGYFVGMKKQEVLRNYFLKNY